MNISKILESIKSFAGVIIAIGSVFGMMYGFNTFIDRKFEEYTPLAMYESLDKRVELSELQALLREARKQKYWILDQLKERPDDRDLLQELEDIEAEIQRLEERIKELKNS